MTNQVKNCSTCGHRSGDRCLLSGYSYRVERQYPSKCGRNFNGWVSAVPVVRKRLTTRIYEFFFGGNDEVM